MDGYQAAKAFRKKGIRTPIVALTANAMEGDEMKCIDAGCNDYLSKPVIYTKLVAMLNKFLGTDSSEVAVSVESNNHITQTDDTDDNEVIINWAKIVEGGMDEQIIQQLIPTYIADNKEHLRELISAVKKAKCYGYSITRPRDKRGWEKSGGGSVIQSGYAARDDGPAGRFVEERRAVKRYYIRIRPGLKNSFRSPTGLKPPRGYRAVK